MSRRARLSGSTTLAEPPISLLHHRARTPRQATTSLAQFDKLPRGALASTSPRLLETRTLTRRSSFFQRVQWRAHALALDDHLRFNEWKKSAPNAYYDSPLIRRVLKSLRELREKEDVEGVCAVLHAALRSNFAGVESFRLYS